MADEEKDRFYNCSMCGTVWPTREDFLADPDLELIGYQVSFKSLATGALCFNHSCRTTLGIWADAFKDLYVGPMFEERKTGTEDCEGHCLYEDDLEACPAECECAYVREIMQIIRNWPKSAAGA